MFRIYRYQDEEELNNDDLSDFEFEEKGTNDEETEDEEMVPLDDSSTEEGGDLEDMGDETESKEEEDPDFAGTIRTVVGAALVYKRKEKSNTYEELWIYTADNNLKKMTEIRNSILAGTDIDPHSERSEDGEQTCDTTTVGNVQYLHIKGLPN